MVVVVVLVVVVVVVVVRGVLVGGTGSRDMLRAFDKSDNRVGLYLWKGTFLQESRS